MKSEHVTRAWECYRDYNYTSYREPMRNQFRELDDYVYGLENENAKLRELVRDMFEEIEASGFDPLVERQGKRGPYYEENPSWRVKIKERMRELGIEAEDA